MRTQPGLEGSTAPSFGTGMPKRRPTAVAETEIEAPARMQ